MEDQEQVKKEMEQQLEKIKYRIQMLDLIEEKLFQMRELAQRVIDEELSNEEIENINQQVKTLEKQFKLLNSESNGIS
ncbi:hypothetical protein Amet_0736 [Alkaliphilus metalliredigens QYMF]|uniref:Uncharacterized protein n=1 Tax=Alkaliphilus metalliredigens (strain QYMF) TaxID=293826 RepID=A6TL93_ALKMQ|nr:hypothetical protein [Alkaliphilus metalliredigens]ABR46961.1 hypothetical protein Amet_0736 [Alkaliphilus metalliredigens QYMF]